MSGVNLNYSLAPVSLPLVWALALTACGTVQQPETTAPSPGSSQPEVAMTAGNSVLDGVFTERQASRGETRFEQVCVACHRINDFAGGRFRIVWVGRTVGDLFLTMSTLMPEDNPGSLSPEEYADIIGYMLRENGYPAGDGDLAADASTLQDIRIEVTGA
jgi:mono/diheme cytochrome c family protein